MQFLNPWLVLGLLAVSIPIIIHILTRQTGRTVDWGAIQFLRDSIVIRNRRIRLEEALLMAARCLLLALLALAIARPYVPPEATLPWFILLPLIFIGAVAIGLAVVLWDMPRWRWSLIASAVAAIVLCALLIGLERQFNLSRFSSGGKQDIALILDVSTSMALEHEGMSNMDRALEEARSIVKRSPRGNAWSLIVAGPTPSARVLIPSSDREEVLRQLDDVQALDGGMAAYDSLTLAALGLAQGGHPSKQIIVITDGQKVGWELESPARWDFLEEAFSNLTSTPRVIVRQMPLPSDLRNVSVASVDWSRDLIGVDRPVQISVTLENTGTEAVSPEAVELLIDGTTLTNRTPGQLLPGGKETLEFSYQFETAGAHEVEARVLVTDEIDRDNRAASAVNVLDELKVLLVDGNPGGRFLERATSFAALALAPAQEPVTGTESEEDDPVRFLVRPEVVPVQEIVRLPALDNWDAIVLGDVPRLPREAAERMESFLRQGGGLLIAAGQRTEPDFYNAWTDQEGEALLPAQFQEAVITLPDAELPNYLAQSTFRHPALQLLADPQTSDLETALLTHHWKLEPNSDAVTGARLASGDPWMVAREVGRGNLMLLASSLDLRSGNLPARQSFLPLVHELVYFLADPGRYQLNLEPRWELALHLTGNEHTIAGYGLRGKYSSQDETVMTERLDASVQFDWRSGAPAETIPADNFSVLWEGKLQPQQSGKYRFDSAVDDYINVRIDGQEVYRSETGGRNEKARSVWLDSNKLHDLRIEFRENSGDARAVLYWESENVERQIVPPEVLRPLGLDDSGNDKVIATYPARDPFGRTRSASIEASPGGAVARIHGDVSAGAWRILVPEEDRDRFPELLGEEGSFIPFTVQRSAEESRLEPMTEQDEEFLGARVGMAQPASPDEVLSILAGESWGEELWKYLAVGALAFLLLEIALSRWIASGRQAGEQEVEFSFAEQTRP